MRTNIVLLTLALTVGGPTLAACHANKAADPKVVAALDDSLESGQITQADHDAKVGRLQAEAAATPAGKVQMSSKLKTVEIVDPAYGMVAFRTQIPEDWNFEGIFLRDPSCGLVAGVAYRVTSPDGLAGYQVMPQFGWHWSDDPIAMQQYRKNYCKVMMAMSAADFLKYVLPAIRPNPTAGPIEPTFDAARLDSLRAQYNARNQGLRNKEVKTGGSVHSRVTYVLHGHPMEENLRVVTQTFESRTGAYGGPVHRAWASFANVSGTRAPKGQLDDLMKTIGPILSKGDYTPEWEERILHQIAADGAHELAALRKQADDASKMLQGIHDATMQRSKDTHDAQMRQSQQSFDASQQADRDRTDAMHRTAVAWELYSGDEQLVRNNSTGEVSRVTNQYGKNGYQDQTSGDIVLSDNPNFNPNFYLRGSWTQLENVNPIKP